MANPNKATEIAAAGDYPSRAFGQRERKLLQTAESYAPDDEDNWDDVPTAQDAALDELAARMTEVEGETPGSVTTTEGDLIVGDAAGLAIRLAKGSSGLPLVAGASTVSYAQLAAAGIASSAVTLAKLHSGVAPSHVIKYAGQPTTVGGAAAEAFTVSGVAATDLAFVQIVDNGTANVTALQAVCTTNTLTVTFSGNPGADCIFNYQVLRAAT